MARILLLSDIHVDTYHTVDIGKIYEYTWDIIVIAGDVGQLGHIENMVSEVADDFGDRQIIVVLGNHEHYMAGIPVRQFEYDVGSYVLSNKFYPNVHVLCAGQSVVIDDITFIGATLWSDLGLVDNLDIHEELKQYVSHKIKDFQLINNGNFTPDDSVEYFYRDRQGIIESLNNVTTDKTIVITHFSPTIDYRNRDYPLDKLSYYFTGEMRDVIDKFQPDYWVSGHTHSNDPDITIGKTILTSNQYHKIGSITTKFIDF